MAHFEQLQLTAPAPESAPRNLSLQPPQQEELRSFGTDLVVRILDSAEHIELAQLEDQGVPETATHFVGQLSFIDNMGPIEFVTYEDETRRVIGEQVEHPADVLEAAAALESIFGPEGIPEQQFDPSMDGHDVRQMLLELFGDRDYPPYYLVTELASIIAETYIQQQQVVRGGLYPYASYERAEACVLGAMRQTFVMQRRTDVSLVEQEELFAVMSEEVVHG